MIEKFQDLLSCFLFCTQLPGGVLISWDESKETNLRMIGDYMRTHAHIHIDVYVCIYQIMLYQY